MFGISFSELILILLTSLVVFGPKQLPLIAYKLGSIIKKINTLVYNVKNNIYINNQLTDLNIIRTQLTNSYQLLKNQINNTNTLSSDENNLISLLNPLLEENNFYQPELGFDKQPELFD